MNRIASDWGVFLLLRLSCILSSCSEEALSNCWKCNIVVRNGFSCITISTAATVLRLNWDGALSVGGNQRQTNLLNTTDDRPIASRCLPVAGNALRQPVTWYPKEVPVDSIRAVKSKRLNATLNVRRIQLISNTLQQIPALDSKSLVTLQNDKWMVTCPLEVVEWGRGRGALRSAKVKSSNRIFWFLFD